MKKPSGFLRTIKSYSKSEKIISFILVVIILLFGTKLVVDNFSAKVAQGKEGVYTEGFANGIFRINPVYSDLNEADRDVSKLVFRGLTKYNSKAQAIVGDMADITISEDKLTYTFEIHDNIKFHDGEILDADDVIFTFQTIVQNPEFQNPLLWANFEGVEINKVDDMTVEFILTAPNSFFITNTTVGVLPEHILSEVPIYELLNHEFNFNPVGTGPYKIESPLNTTMTGVTQVVLERFDEFYGELPEITKMRFFGYPSKQDLIDNSDSLNAIPKVTEEVIAAMSDNSRFSMSGYSLPQYFAVFINMEHSTLKSNKVREALQLSIYKNAFLDILPNTIKVETPVMSLDQDDYRYTANMDDAKELLYDAGWIKFTPGEEVATEEEEISDVAADEEEEEAPEVTDTEITEEVVEEETGEPEVLMRKNAAGTLLEFKMIARLYPEDSFKYKETETVLNYLQENWQKAGIKLNIELYDVATLQEKISAKDYDLLLFGQGLGYNLDLYGFWHSTQAGEGGLNLSNYKSFAVDTMIEQIRATFDEDEKDALLKKMAGIIQDDIPAIFLYRPVYYYASDNKVQGIELDNMAFASDRFCRLNEWTF